MSKSIYRMLVGPFAIGESFEVVDIISSDSSYLSAACFEHNGEWIVEILSERRIMQSSVSEKLCNYKHKILKSEELVDVDWLQKCFENFAPITIGDFYLFGPHLKSKPVPRHKIAIEIAAATAFGSGEHPTTNRCILACNSYFDPKIHKSVLDIGCGSGILSIVMAKLGARYVYAYDNDPEAVHVALENTATNHVEQQVTVCRNSEFEFSIRKYDFVVSNIFSGPLISMRDVIISSMNPGAIIVLSGFMSSNKDVQSKYCESGLSFVHRYDMNRWSTVVLRKPR